MRYRCWAIAATIAFAPIAAAQAAGTGHPRLRASVAPCSLRTPDLHNEGIRHGDFVVVVRDSSPRRYFALDGRGVTRRTSAGFVGVKIWQVHLARGLYRFRCGASHLEQGVLRVL